jgi:thiamine-phosphate pyrophosphorylase
LKNNNSKAIYRIIDANLNRLREALRVIEEYFRFISNDKNVTVKLKLLRHSLEEFEKGFDRKTLLSSRDTDTDPFALKNRKEELNRSNILETLIANIKRTQEAARVLEEYSKLTDRPQMSEKAKETRFALYEIEKIIVEKQLEK